MELVTRLFLKVAITQTISGHATTLKGAFMESIWWDRSVCPQLLLQWGEHLVTCLSYKLSM